MHSRDVLRLTSRSIFAGVVLACGRPARVASSPAVGARLERVAEQPGPSTSTFDRACATRLRDSATGREYLLTRSEILHDTRHTDSVTTSVLRRAVGEYAPIVEGARGPDSARVRVDCTTSQVLAPDAR